MIVPQRPQEQRGDRQRHRDGPVQPEGVGHDPAGAAVVRVTVRVEVEEVHSEEALLASDMQVQCVQYMYCVGVGVGEV